MALPERPPDTPPTTLERRVEGIQERALLMLVGHAINFPEYLFSRRCDFLGFSPQQDAQLENTCFKRATQNPPRTDNARQVIKPNESWII